MRKILAAVIVVGGTACPVGIGCAFAQTIEEAPKEIIAVHIRRQGFSCEKALSAERDRARSKPDEPVWLLKCDGYTYRVRLIPDKAADVQRID